MATIKNEFNKRIVGKFSYDNWHYRELVDVMEASEENDGMESILNELREVLETQAFTASGLYDLSITRIDELTEGEFDLEMIEVRYNRIKHEVTYIIGIEYHSGGKDKIKLISDQSEKDAEIIKKRMR